MLSRLTSPLRSLYRRPFSDWCLLGEAIGILIWSKIRLYKSPFSLIAPDLGIPQAESLRQVSAAQHNLASKISWAVETGARYVPLRLVCLPQAMAANFMLGRRAIDSTLYLGVRIDQAAAFSAHAWLRAGRKWVTGGNARHGQTVVACFAKIELSTFDWMARFRLTVALGVLATLAVLTLMPVPPLYDITWQNAPARLRDLAHLIGKNDYWFNFFGFSAATLLFNFSLYGFCRATFRYRWAAIIFLWVVTSLLEIFQLALPGRNFDLMDIASSSLAIPIASLFWIKPRRSGTSSPRQSSLLV